MTTLMKSLLSTVEKLPAKRQEFVAYILLEELGAEDAWEKHFSKTSEEKFQKLTEKVQGEKRVSLEKFLK